MGIEVSLRAMILEDPTLSGLLADQGVHPETLPQNVGLPCVVTRYNGPMPELLSGGVSTISRYTVTLTIFTRTFGDSVQVKNGLISLLNGLSTVSNGITFVSARVLSIEDDYNERLDKYECEIDFNICVTE